jgi:hypothetical protein
MAWVVDDSLKGRVVWMVVIFPAFVYLTCGFYGRKIIRKHLLTKLELMMIESRTGNDLAVSLCVKKFHFYP